MQPGRSSTGCRASASSITADLVRLGVFVALPFVGSAAEILALAAVSGIANSLFRPAVLAGVPNLVSDGELAHGTALLQATDWAAATLGPILGGILTSVSSPHVVYWINAATFAYSALLLLRIPARLLQSEQAISRGHWRDLAEGLTVFRRSAALITVVVAFGFAMLASGLINVSEIFLAEHALHRGAFGYGLLWSASGLGLVVGSLFSGSLLEDRDVTSIFPLVFLPWAAGILGAGIAPNVWVASAGDGARRLRQRPSLPDDGADHPALHDRPARADAPSRWSSARTTRCSEISMVSAGALTQR